MTHVIDMQEDVFTFLADPATHDRSKVTRFDTHAAAIFLAGERALKVKRAVKYPFLDFSTLEKRKAVCEAELEVNKRFAPALYRGVVPITRETDGRLAIGGRGTPVEWAVEMRRFDEEQTLDKLAGRGRLDDALADALGRVMAKVHADASQVEPAPWIEAVGAYIEEHETAFREMPDLFPESEIMQLAAASRKAYQRILPLLAERGRRGLIRRIHGDLHLGNIVLIDGTPVLFDAIEFSELIASGDVLYDIAFLLMDLLERGYGDDASIIFNRYLIETRRDEDLDALAALPFYLSMRAAIRAKVTAARREQAKAKDKPEIERTARKYFDWAGRFLVPAAPVLIAVGGLSGTGKSALARRLCAGLAPPPGAVVLRSDIERKALFGNGERAPLPAEAYSPAVTLRVYAVIVDKARRAIAAGHSAIVDAVFAQPHERGAIEQSAKILGATFHGLFLDADQATRLSRVGSRKGDASDADATVVAQQERYDLGGVDWKRIDAGGTLEQTLERTRAAIERLRGAV